MTAFFIASFMLGLGGSLHCAGMCGPLVLAMPFHVYGREKKIAAILLYNTGRILAYTALGCLAGLFGAGIKWLALSQVLSVCLGILVIVSVAAPRLFNSRFIPITNPLRRIQTRAFQALAGKTQLYHLFISGTLNGLLPCGLVYVALAGAVVAGTVNYAMFFMLNFGLGTLPLLVLVAVIGQQVAVRKRNVLRKLSPYFTLLVGVLLLLRGLYPTLGHQHHSPAAHGEAVNCYVTGR